jgi:hypothetical protein
MYKEIKIGEVLTYIIPLLLSIGVFLLCLKIERDSGGVAVFFAEKMRASIFAGFLTLGSFLLALKTGIVIKIKEGVYDKKEYQEKVLGAAELAGISVYGPLRRLSRLLSVAVFAALTTSALQLSVGLLSNWWAASICLAAAAFALLVVMASFLLIQANLGTWFDLMEEGVVRPSGPAIPALDNAVQKSTP